jgi:predicted HAD superfamily Cof-like phosphohydrolase
MTGRPTSPGDRQRSVQRFHRELGLTVAPAGLPPAIRDPELRIALLREETDEVVGALQEGRLAALGGELADLLYVTYGAAVTFGLALPDGEPLPLAGSPAIRDAAARAEGLAATVRPALEAIARADVPAAEAGLAAIVPAVEEVAAACGLRVGPFFDAVQAANMAKVGGPIRADGKRLKPPGWRPADLDAVLARQRVGG